MVTSPLCPHVILKSPGDSHGITGTCAREGEPRRGEGAPRSKVDGEYDIWIYDIMGILSWDILSWDIYIYMIPHIFVYITYNIWLYGYITSKNNHSATKWAKWGCGAPCQCENGSQPTIWGMNIHVRDSMALSRWHVDNVTYFPELSGKTMVSTVNFPLKSLNQSTEDWFYWNWSFDDWAGSFGGCEVSGFGSTWCAACSAPKGFGMPWISEFESRSRAPSKSMLQNHANLQPSLAVNQTICSTWIKCRWKCCLLQKAQSSFSCCSARRDSKLWLATCQQDLKGTCLSSFRFWISHRWWKRFHRRKSSKVQH